MGKSLEYLRSEIDSMQNRHAPHYGEEPARAARAALSLDLGVLKIGGGYVRVVEPLVVRKKYPAQWKRVKS